MNNETVTVLVHRCRMEINLEPFFDKSTLVNIRKLFRYVFQEPWRNTETIAALGEYLPAKVAETKEAWGKTSQPGENARYIERENKRPPCRCKACKSQARKIPKDPYRL